MSEKKPVPPPRSFLGDRYRREFVEVACPLCNKSKIICVPEESIPKCDFCRVEMTIKEILTEGKY